MSKQLKEFSNSQMPYLEVLKLVSQYMKKKILLLLLLIFILGFIFFACYGLANAFFGIGGKELKTETAKKGSIKQTVTASGEIATEKQADLQFQLSGKVVWVGIEKGDKVKKGQAVASLDKRQLEKKLRKDLLDYMNERWDFEQTADDYKDKVLDETIRRIKEKSQFDLDKSVLDVEIAKLVQEEAVLISPIDGEITDISELVAGENINTVTNPANITVTDFSSLVFKARVEEVDLAEIKPGQKTIVTLDAYPDEEFKGEVLRINRVAQKNVVGGTIIPVDIKIEADEKFIVGLNGDVQILIEEKPDALIVPRGAVHRENDSHFVWVVKDGKPKKQIVTVGLRSAKITEINQGLQEGDKIVIGKINGK